MQTPVAVPDPTLYGRRTPVGGLRGSPFAAGLSVVVHGALIVLALVLFRQADAARPASLTVIGLSSSPAQATQPKPAHLRKPHPVPQPVEIPAVLEIPDSPQVIAASAPAAQATAGGCDLTDTVQAALRANAQVSEQLTLIPAGQRSVANALALWNQTWVNHADQPSATAFGRIRETVVRVVTAATDDCRNQAQAGPRLIYVPDANGLTTVLALGSGQWTWQQVAQSAQIEPVPQPDHAAAATSASGLTTATGSAGLPSLSAQPVRSRPPVIRTSAG